MDIRVVLAIGLILSVIIGWKWWDYSSTVAKQEKEIIALKEDKVTLRTDLQTEKNNVELLKKALNETNQQINKLEAKYQKTQAEYNKFVNQDKKDWFTNQGWSDLVNSGLWNSPLCEEGLRLNKTISELKYEDL